jgi:glycosyltransferase involved in cell wall biosynthesis
MAPVIISIVITCYNHGSYLQKAIDSILCQNRNDTEIIVVDDGSIDDTAAVTRSNAVVRYIYQENGGLPAARNTGIEHSNGKYIAFLDADDWFLPDSLDINCKLLDEDETLAFVSGAHIKVNAGGDTIETSIATVSSDHYQHLLTGNYIGMHATVMYRKSVFEKLKFDTALHACEDYDMYFKIARSKKVKHHEQVLAAYRIHNQNMSSNTLLMLDTTLLVLERQKTFLKNESEKQAYRTGISVWKNYYCYKAYNTLVNHPQALSASLLSEVAALRKHNLLLYFKSILIRNLFRFGIQKPPINRT